jgi:hypothetical protein
VKNFKSIIKELVKLGFVVENGEGSLIKIYPSDNNLPFYSCHSGEKALHPLRRFSKKHWNVDLRKV